MEGYVYIARIIDHGGKFVNGYHKIGLSKQYKVRETQLNSTHLPFDVFMVRVFETDNMKKLEGLLHICFEDYRVVKEYDYRKNITTEWFNVSDIDMFNDRLDKFIELMNIDEVDMGISIDNDGTMSQSEKDLVKSNIDNGRNTNSKLRIEYNGHDLTRKYNYETFFEFLKKVGEIVGYDKLMSFEPYVVKNIEDLPKCFQNPDSKQIIEYGEYKFLTYGSIRKKKRKINQILDYFNVEGFNIDIQTS